MTTTERAAKIVELAMKLQTDELEFGPGQTFVSEDEEGTDNGAWVSAWVWVDFSGTELDKNKEKDK